MTISTLHTLFWLLESAQYVNLVFDLDSETTTTLDMYWMFILSSDLILHTSIIPIDLTIIIKEISMKYF